MSVTESLKSVDELLAMATKRPLFRVWLIGNEIRAAGLACQVEGDSKQVFIAALELTVGAEASVRYDSYVHAPTDWGLIGLRRQWGKFNGWIEDDDVAVSACTCCGTYKELAVNGEIVLRTIGQLVERIKADDKLAAVASRFSDQLAKLLAASPTS